MNKCVLTGFIASDIEQRTTQSGIQNASFRLAVRRRYKNSEGQYDADFIRITCWRNTADFVGKYFGKGDACAVEGSIQVRSYDKDGQKQFITEIVADNVEHCGKRDDSNHGGNQNEAYVDQHPTGYEGGFTEVDDDSLPF